MKKILLFAASAILASHSAFAFLPTSAVTSMTLPVYGVYMSSDPTCQTGMVATVALSTTPQQINFVANPAIGTSNNLPSTIGCVVIVIQNNFSSAWSAGSYTSTSGGLSDNVCNGGGSTSGKQICHSGNVIAWPSQITTDAAAIGLSLPSGTCAGSASEAVPMVLSTDSACTGNNTADNGVSGCANGSSTDNFTLPSGAGDVSHGTLMTSPSTSGNLKFVVNPTNAFGNNSGTCGNTSPPLFSFAAD